MATTDALAVYLYSRGVVPQQLFEVREAIELASVDLACSRLDKSAIGVLTQTLVEEMATPATEKSRSHILHLKIAELAGNPAIVLFLHALTRLTEYHQFGPEEGLPMSYEEAAASVSRVHASIVQAIAASDADAAKRRMLRHLRAVPPLLR
jgi:DNA-binding FadR family transcriptional regulator